MPKLIKLIHPYEVENVKSVKEFLFILKSILRIAEKSGLDEKKDGILIPIRWSQKHNQCVDDRGTDLYRDRDGITLNNIDNYFYKDKHKLISKAIKYTLTSIDNKVFHDSIKKYNMHKNENKFLCFEYCNNVTNIIDNKSEFLYFIGLLQRCETKKRLGVFNKIHRSIFLDKSLDLYQDISLIFKCILSHNRFTVTNHTTIYDMFLSSLKTKDFHVYIDNVNTEFKWKNIFLSTLSNTNTNKLKHAIKLYNLNNKFSISEFNDIKTEYFIFRIYTEFLTFLKEYYDVEMSEGFVVTDLKNHVYYKLSHVKRKSFNFTNNNNSNQYAPLIPGVF